MNPGNLAALRMVAKIGFGFAQHVGGKVQTCDAAIRAAVRNVVKSNSHTLPRRGVNRAQASMDAVSESGLTVKSSPGCFAGPLLPGAISLAMLSPSVRLLRRLTAAA